MAVSAGEGGGALAHEAAVVGSIEAGSAVTAGLGGARVVGDLAVAAHEPQRALARVRARSGRGEKRRYNLDHDETLAKHIKLKAKAK